MVAEPLDNIYLFIFPPFPYKFHCTFECVIHTVYSSMQRKRKTRIILKDKNMKVHRSFLYLAADIFPLENFLFNLLMMRMAHNVLHFNRLQDHLHNHNFPTINFNLFYKIFGQKNFFKKISRIFFQNIEKMLGVVCRCRQHHT